MWHILRSRMFSRKSACLNPLFFNGFELSLSSLGRFMNPSTGIADPNYLKMYNPIIIVCIHE